MLLSGLTGLPIAGPIASAGAAVVSASAAVSAVGAQALAAAAASLEAGQGPAAGQPTACGVSAGALQGSCTVAVGSTASTLTASTSTSPGNIGGQKWESEVAPTPRSSSVMTYDAKDRYVVLFGGYNGSAYLNETWEFSHGMWVQLAPGHSPSPRANATIAYDATDQYVVLFGGYDGVVLGDTWKFVGGSWTQLLPSTSPPAREDATMSFDARDGYLVLFGGRAGSTALGDTWTFVKGTWTALTPLSSPSPRWGSASTFDAADNYVLLFGGASSSGLLGDTWEFAAGAWTELTPSSPPSPRFEAGMAYDANASAGFVVLFGGASRSGSQWVADGDTWRFSNGHWSPIVPSPGVHPPGQKGLPYSSPAARQAFGMTYSIAAGEIVVFGGIVDGDPFSPSLPPNTQFYGPTDTWTYTTEGWSQALQQSEFTWAQLPGRVGAAVAYDPTAQYNVGTVPETGYLVEFGGSTAYGPNAETWIFLSYPTAVWSETFPVTSPSARSYAAMTYDARDGYVLLFGGMSPAGTALGDTWEFQNGNWTQISTSAAPSPRYGAMMAYDNATGFVVLYGGAAGTTHFSDTWTFQGGVWTELSVRHPPTARAFGGLAWDSKTGYVVLFGGTTGSAALGDTWKFVSGQWTQLKLTTASPPADWGMTLLANGKSNNVFLFGGCSAPSFDPLDPSCPAADTLGTPWAFGASWAIIPAVPRLTAIPAAPEARFLAAGAYDLHAPTNVVLLFDGISSNGAWISDRWVFQSNIWNPWAPQVLPVARYGAASTWDDRSQNMLMFGGIGPKSNGHIGFLNDTWEWDTGAWGATHPPVSPSARAFASMVYFGNMIELKGPTSYNNSVLFGGVGPNGYLGDTWYWVGSEVGGHWTQVSSSVSPSPRANASIAYDAADNEVVLFGGQNAGGYLGDTWVFNVHGQWTQLSPSVSPSPRAAAAMAYDHEDGYVLLFGGVGPSGPLGDTWTFLHGVWTELSTSSAPGPRYGAGIVDCPTLVALGAGEPQVVLLVGGTNGTAYFGDTWAYLGGQWTLLPTTQPDTTPFAFGAMSNDLDDGHPSVFGGITAYGILSDFWEFKLGP